MTVDDAALVLAARTGDRAAWAGIYDRYADRLHDFCWSVLRDRDEAADAMHDAFITAYNKLDQLRDPTRLRSWLFAIARNEALAHARKRKRAVPTEELEVTAVGGAPDDVAQASELRDLVWTAAAGLAARDRAALDLHLRQGLEGAALGEALGTSADNANVLLSRLRDQVERSLGAYLVARRGRGECAGLDGLLESWDNEFTPLWRKRIARHVDDCPTCEDRKRSMVSPLALLASVPLLPAPADLRDRVLNNIDLISASRPIDERRRSQRRRAGIAAGLAAAIALILGILAMTDNGSTPVDSQLATATTIDALTPPTIGIDTTTSTDDGPAPTGTTRRGSAPTTARPATFPTIPPTTAPPAATTTTIPPIYPPVTVSSSAGPRSLCVNQQSPVSATVGGGNGSFAAQRVRLFASGPGSQVNKAMAPAGSGSWSAQLGPLTTPGTYTWWVRAVDSVGNVGESARKTVVVSVCPQ